MGDSSVDPLDRPDFDPVAYINQRFATEESLDNLDTFVIGINSQIYVLDDEISKAVQAQNILGEQASKEIAEAHQSIGELFGKIEDIKEKASQSENMVQEICADIKKLDYAKNHLQTSVTALKRLQMLITAVGQLEMLNNDYSYRDAANLLDAVKQLLSHFLKYTSIPMICEIKDKLNEIQTDLRKHVHRAFREIGQIVDTVADPEILSSHILGNNATLGDACIIVDALGYQFRHELLEEFVQLQLVPYEKIFGPEKPHYQLDDVERRWAWFKRLLKSIDLKFAAIFPPHWKVSLRLCLEFVERTKIHLALLLTELESRDQSDVNALLKALKTALRFEKEMAVRFDVKECDDAESELSKLAAASDKRNDQQLKTDGKLMYIPTQDLAISKEEQDDKKFVKLAHAAISGGISSVFDKFLGSYVSLERSNLEEMLEKLAKDEDNTSSAAGHGNVYGSSINMFVFIKNSINRCISLTNGQTFLSLTLEFKACMQQYVDMLRSRCPPAITHSSTGPLSYRLAPGAEIGVCYLINTGEYCAEVVPQLQQLVKQKISPNHMEKVDFMTEVDGFTDLVALALKVLVSGIIDRMDPAFRMMQGTNWAALEDVAEESAYCREFQSVVMETIPNVRDSLSPSYFNNFCMKCATEILQRYNECITKQKRITELGSQQLLLDTYNLKTLLLQLHSAGGSSRPAAVSPIYTRLINSKAGQIEVILKLVGTPEELLVDRFRAMWPDGQATDLQMLMSLKGMRKTDQQTFIETLGTGFSGFGSAANVLSNTAAGVAIASSAFTSSARTAVGNLNNLKWG